LKDTQGYGSDSSDDEDGVVPSRRPGAKDEDGDEEMDMFADEPADKPTDAGKGKGKEKAKDEFMDLEEIEGQEFAKPKQALDDDDSDSEDEGGKRDKKTGLDGDMGELTPFNMKKEMTEGRFTKDGQEYTENEKDPHEKHDHWLDSMDKDAIKLARRAHRERERLEKEREEKEDEVSGIGSEAREQKLMRDAVALMERGETVLEALQRLGKEEKKKDTGKKKSWAERQKERKEHAR
jgi:CD2 antigen cytoplasmic tail-binding protein 2